MDSAKARNLYKSFKKNATYSALGLYFDDNREQLFVKEFPVRKSILINYKDIEGDFWNQEDKYTVNKGHPIWGAFIGNLIAGFGGGFVGAIAGQQADGRHLSYVVDPYVSLMMRPNHDFHDHRLFSGRIKENGVLDYEYRKQVAQLKKHFNRVEHKYEFYDYDKD